jgi:peptidoglycan/xylan/chitin deacetylase (PgdA/CDA1 family)
MLHDVHSNASFPSPLTLPASQFRRRVALLAGLGFTGVSSLVLRRWIAQAGPLPSRPLLLTFDDAFASIGTHALPVLEEFGWSATIFVPGANIGGVNDWDRTGGTAGQAIASADDIARWADRGFEIGCHALQHVDLRTVPDAELRAALDEAQRMLAALTGGPVRSFAYPYGAVDQRVRNIAAEFFDIGFGTQEGLVNRRSDTMILPRTMPLPGDTAIGTLLRAYTGHNPVVSVRRRLRLRSRLQSLRW